MLASLLVLISAGLLAQSNEKGAGAKTTAASRPDRAAVEAGKEVYKQYCAICHFERSAAQKIGPGLKDLFRRGTFTDGKKADNSGLRVWIEKGGKDMPGFKDSLSPEQTRALMAYVKTL